MITLYTAATPNGWKASVALEELDVPYEVQRIDLGADEQKQDWFLAINPNGRIPAIVDREPAGGGGDLAVFESGAILVYLAEKTGRLLPTTAHARAEVMGWLMFQMGGVGPMMGQANVFHRYAPERIEWAIGRYQRESLRLLGVLDKRLADREFLAGDYSIADIANWCWASTSKWTGIDIEGLPHLRRWIDQLATRPAVIRGRAIPRRADIDDPAGRAEIVESARKMLA